MLASPIQNAIEFIITTFFNIYISIVLIRLILQLVRADFYNPIAQTIYKLTNPIIMPMNKIIPRYRKLELSVILLALILQASELAIMLYIRGFHIPFTLNTVSGLIVLGAGQLIDLAILIYMIATFILVILSWIQPRQYNPILILIAQIVDPLYRRVGRLMPNTGALDFTAMAIIFLLILSRILISEPIMQIGKTLIAKG